MWAFREWLSFPTLGLPVSLLLQEGAGAGRAGALEEDEEGVRWGAGETDQ